jgi:diacylglycerol kinase family enzyme
VFAHYFWQRKQPSLTFIQVLHPINILRTSYHLAPPARINDGAFTLMWTTEATRLQGIDFLLKSEKGEHLGLPFLHHEKVSQCREMAAMECSLSD